MISESEDQVSNRNTASQKTHHTSTPMGLAEFKSRESSIILFLG